MVESAGNDKIQASAPQESAPQEQPLTLESNSAKKESLQLDLEDEPNEERDLNKSPSSSAETSSHAEANAQQNHQSGSNGEYDKELESTAPGNGREEEEDDDDDDDDERDLEWQQPLIPNNTELLRQQMDDLMQRVLTLEQDGRLQKQQQQKRQLELQPLIAPGREALDEDFSTVRDPTISPSDRELPLERIKLSPDTFSFLIVCGGACSIPFFTSIGVVVLKNAIFALILGDITNQNEKEEDGLDIPVMVSAVVFASQMVSYVLAVLTQNDFLTAFTLWFHRGSTKGGAADRGAPWQWDMGFFLALLDGIIGLTTTVLLVMTSSTVLEVLLNFAAVTFVSCMDEYFFVLSKLGLLGGVNQNAARVVERKSFPSPLSSKHRTWLQRALLVCLLIIVMSFGILVYIRQISGYFATENIYVQFGDSDDIRLDLASHSGFYVLDTDLSSRRRRSDGFVYREERNGGGLVGYCSQKSIWTFSRNNNSDACDGIEVQSGLTDSFNVLESSLLNWYVRLPESSQSIPMHEFYLSSGCRNNDDCGGEDRGMCSNNRCICSPDYSGVRCVHRASSTCAALELNELFSIAFASQRAIASSYDLYPGECYNRPIYLNQQTGDIIFFAGVHWLVTNVHYAFPASEEHPLERIQTSSFHARDIKYVDLFSERVIFRSAQDLRNSPVGLNWFELSGPSRNSLFQLSDKAEISPSDMVPLLSFPRFLCSVCNKLTNPCFYEGVCGSDGACVCSHSATGKPK